jgi:arabinan endo-1,5-alpha-L-arabinosidase
MGIDMIQGGGKLFLGSQGRVVGPGHFGLIDAGDGVQKFSCHYEADLDRGGSSVLDIRPLLWKDGWPEAGDNVKPGTYWIQSARNGNVLEPAVQSVPVGGGGRGRGFGGRRGGGPPVPDQDIAQVSKDWPAGNLDTRLSHYMLQAQQKWSIAPAPNAGGYLGSPYFKITVAGTDRTLAATKEGELVVLPSFTGAAGQLWRIDQFGDGTYRIGPKSMPDSGESMYLSAVGSGLATLKKYDPNSDKQHWSLNVP